MAGQKNIRQNNNKRHYVMEKSDYIYFLALGILLFYVSTFLDRYVYSAFEIARMPLLDSVFSIITNFGVVMVLFLAMPSIMFYKKDSKVVCFLILAFVSAFLISFILKLIVLRQRPLETLAYPLINIINYSFPSMHSMVVFALLPFLIYFMPKQKYFWVIAVILVAFTRIYFSFHYLSDVVFGIVAGHFIGEFLLMLHKRGKLWKS